jgi:predicted CxxxxCH...CXXCH cytochrome family protein
VWTGSNQADCGSCHDAGLNPAALGGLHEGHVFAAGLACADCHAAVVDLSDSIVGLALHVNGAVDTLTRDPAVCDQCHGNSAEACTSCHGGTDNLTGAPPVGLRGETATTQLAVGAHTTHMEGGTLADAFDCSDCHLVPTSLLSPGHYDPDSVAEMTWSALAGAGSTWNRAAATCENTYCHGNFSGGDAANTPVWTGSNQADCGSCHDAGTNPATLSGRHEKHINERNLDCIECHVTVVDAQDIIVGRSLHVNGADNVVFLRGGTYSGGSCTGLDGNACHGRKSWSNN